MQTRHPNSLRNLVITREQRAENAKKGAKTKRQRTKEKHSALLERYLEEGMSRLSDAEAGVKLGVSAHTLGRILRGK